MIPPTFYQRPVTPEHVEIAIEYYHSLKKLNNSHTDQQGKIPGKIGELVSLPLIGGAIANNIHYDILHPSQARFEVKTICCTSRPYPDYLCHVSDYNPNQDCDYYLFVRLLQLKNLGPDLPVWHRHVYPKAWVLGLSPKWEFDKLKFLLKKGQLDPTSKKPYPIPFTCWNIQGKHLWDIRSLQADGSLFWNNKKSLLTANRGCEIVSA